MVDIPESENDLMFDKDSRRVLLFDRKDAKGERIKTILNQDQ